LKKRALCIRGPSQKVAFDIKKIRTTEMEGDLRGGRTGGATGQKRPLPPKSGATKGGGKGAAGPKK